GQRGRQWKKERNFGANVLNRSYIFKQVYERGTNVEQFVTRFLLKESANQIQSLLSSVESAVDAIDEQHSQSGHQPAKVSPRMSERRNENTVPDYPPNNRVTAREAVRTVNTASGAVEVRKEGLDSQINRLAELIGRLENKSLLLIRTEMVVTQKKLGDFCEALKQYLKNVSTQRDCFHVTAVRLPDGLSFVVYEFWDGEEEWKRHLQSAPNKAFQHVKVDTLCQPETVSSVAVPGTEHEDIQLHAATPGRSPPPPESPSDPHTFSPPCVLPTLTPPKPPRLSTLTFLNSF
ncbi:hypothetical protein KUCAC02_020830, partial [Chaenocephalus aceratus]